jgi:hypothetical protein
VHGAAASPVPHGILHDAAGSITAVVNPAGAVEETLRYGLHGETQVYNSFIAPIGFSGLGNAIGFGGLYHDFELGFHVVGARHFYPAFGRFIADTSPLLPSAPLQLNGYFFGGLPGLPGEVAGRGSKTRGAEYLEPFRVGISGARGTDPFAPGKRGTK